MWKKLWKTLVSTKWKQKSGVLWPFWDGNFFFKFISFNFFVRILPYFLKEFLERFLPTPKHKKKLRQKLLIIPLDQQSSVQPVFTFCYFIAWNFLIFEVFKLYRMKKILRIALRRYHAQKYNTSLPTFRVNSTLKVLSNLQTSTGIPLQRHSA